MESLLYRLIGSFASLYGNGDVSIPSKLPNWVVRKRFVSLFTLATLNAIFHCKKRAKNIFKRYLIEIVFKHFLLFGVVPSTNYFTLWLQR